MLRRAIAILLLIPAVACGALPATTVWEIRTDGSPTNGGGYKSNAGTTDYSQQAAAQLSVSDAACTTGGTTVTSATGGFTAAMVGNICYLSGTHFTTGWYEITAYSDGNTISVDRDPTDGSNGSSGTCNVGGALKCPGDLGVVFQTAAQSVAGMKAYVRNTGTAYALDTATANTAATTGYGGPLDLDASQMASKAFYIKGYDPAQGRDSFAGTRPIIDANGNNPSNGAVIELDGTSGNNQHVCAFFEVDGDDTATNGLFANSMLYNTFISCVSHNATQIGILRTKAVACWSYSNGNHGFQEYAAIVCRSTGNGGDGFYYGTREHVACIADGNTESGFDSSANYTFFNSCLAVDNGNDGFSSAYASFVNCISYSNGVYEYNINVASVLVNCASGDVASGRYPAATPPAIDLSKVELTGDPFVDRDNATIGSRDFNLIATGGGLQCRAAGISPYGQTGYLDIGAVQHADPAASGGETSHVWVR